MRRAGRSYRRYHCSGVGVEPGVTAVGREREREVETEEPRPSRFSSAMQLMTVRGNANPHGHTRREIANEHVSCIVGVGFHKLCRE
jgi:hypothetical protein